MTFSIVSPITEVQSAANTALAVSPITSLEQIGSVVYLRMPFSGPSAASFIAALTASLVTGLAISQVRSTQLPVGTGTRSEIPVILPLSAGITIPTALAAPVLVGMM